MQRQLPLAMLRTERQELSIGIDDIVPQLRDRVRRLESDLYYEKDRTGRYGEEIVNLCGEIDICNATNATKDQMLVKIEAYWAAGNFSRDPELWLEIRKAIKGGSSCENDCTKP